MAVKPTDLLLWVPGAEPAKMTSPSGAKRTEGWTSGEKPAFQTMNYLQNNWGQWLSYFETVTDTNIIHVNGDGSDHADVANNSTNIGTNGTAIALNITNIGLNASDISDNAFDIATNVTDISTINADTNVYAIVQGDTSSTSGTFTLTTGFIRWHISGKKIWVYWEIVGSLTVADSIALTIDVVTNTTIPNTPWAKLIEATAEEFGTGSYMILGIPLGFTIKKSDGSNIPQGSLAFGGSFFHQLP